MIDFQVSINVAYLVIAVLVVLLFVIAVSLCVIASKLTELHYIYNKLDDIKDNLFDKSYNMSVGKSLHDIDMVLWKLYEDALANRGGKKNGE